MVSIKAHTWTTWTETYITDNLEGINILFLLPSHHISISIFWNEKTQEAQKEQAAETEAEPQQEQTKTAKPETTKKTDAKVEEQFDVLLEDPTPEKKKKIHALWLKLEKEAKDRATEVQKLKSQVLSLPKNIFG